MPNVTDFEVRNLICAVREVLEMDISDPAGQLAALEKLACALELIDDCDPPIDVQPDDGDDADVPHVLT